MEHRVLDRPRDSKKNTKRVCESDASRGLEKKTEYPGSIAIPSDT